MKKRTVLVGMLAALTMFAAGCGGKDAAKESRSFVQARNRPLPLLNSRKRIPRISRALIWI